MFSTQGFGEYAFSEQPDAPLDPDAFRAFLAQATESRCWLLEIDAFSLATVSARGSDFGDAGFGELGFSDDDAGVTGGLTTLRYSSHGYVSKIYTGGVAGGDSASRDYYDGRLVESMRITRSIAGARGIGGIARTIAEVELRNDDGALDMLSTNYALDGRAARLYLGRVTDRRSSFGLVFSGVIKETPKTGLGSMRISLSDGFAKLDLPVQTTVYAGSGGTEGGADLKGKPKPLTFGYGWNEPGPLVNSATLVYQLHEAAIQDIPAAYDRGISLTKVPGAPGAGQYQVSAAAATATLGATPSGQVTFDVEGDSTTAGFVSTAAQIVQRLLNRAALTTSDLDTTSLAQLAGDQPAPVGLWVGTDPRTIADCIDEMLSGIGAFGGFNRQGAFSVGLIVSPSMKTPASSYDQRDILDIQVEPLPGPVEPIIWRARVGYQPNEAVQTDLAAGVSAARRTFAAADYRLSKSDDSSIVSRRLLAQDYGVLARFKNSADADTETARLMALWGVPRAALRVTLPLKGLTDDLGKVILLTHPRFGLASGKPAFVYGYLLTSTRVQLLVFV